MSNKKIVKFIDLIYGTLMVNIAFFSTMFPVLISIFLLSPELKNLFLFYLFFIPIGPSLISLFHVTKIIRKKDVDNIFKKYYSTWRRYFKKGVIYFSYFFIVFVIALVDIHFFSKINWLTWLNSLIIIFMLLTISLLINVFFQEMNGFSFKELCFKALTITFIKPLWALANVLLLITLFLSMILQPVLGFLVFPGVISRIILKNIERCWDSFK